MKCFVGCAHVYNQCFQFYCREKSHIAGEVTWISTRIVKMGEKVIVSFIRMYENSSHPTVVLDIKVGWSGRIIPRSQTPLQVLNPLPIVNGISFPFFYPSQPDPWFSLHCIGRNAEPLHLSYWCLAYNHVPQCFGCHVNRLLNTAQC